MPVFALRSRLDGTAEIGRDELHSITDPKDRNLGPLVKVVGETRRILIAHTGRTAGEDDTLRLLRDDLINAEIERMDLAINALLAHTSRDQLRVLRAKIKNKDEFMMHGLF